MGTDSPEEGGRKGFNWQGETDRAEECTDREGSKQEHGSGVGQSQSSLGRKSRRACPSCSTYIFGSSFPASVNSTETY